MRVRASCRGGLVSRRRETLEKLLQEARSEVQRLREKTGCACHRSITKQEVASEEPPAAESEPSRQEQAAAMRHAEERLEHVEQALERMPEMEAKIMPGEHKEARVSQRTRQRR